MSAIVWGDLDTKLYLSFEGNVERQRHRDVRFLLCSILWKDKWIRKGKILHQILCTGKFGIAKIHIFSVAYEGITNVKASTGSLPGLTRALPWKQMDHPLTSQWETLMEGIWFQKRREKAVFLHEQTYMKEGHNGAHSSQEKQIHCPQRFMWIHILVKYNIPELDQQLAQRFCSLPQNKEEDDRLLLPLKSAKS